MCEGGCATMHSQDTHDESQGSPHQETQGVNRSLAFLEQILANTAPTIAAASESIKAFSDYQPIID